MSTDQPTLDAFASDSEGEGEDSDETAEEPAWSFNSDHTGRSCNACGAHVSESFARVCGDREHEVHACLECAMKEEIREGAAAGKERTTDLCGVGYDA